MDQNAKPTKTDPDQLVQILLAYNLVSKRLEVRAKCDTILLEGVLADAILNVSQSPLVDTTAEVAADGIIRVTVDYDMRTGKHSIQAQSSHILVKSILQHALSCITRNQIVQGLQAERDALKTRVAALEAKVSPPLLSSAGLPVGKPS